MHRRCDLMGKAATRSGTATHPCPCPLTVLAACGTATYRCRMPAMTPPERVKAPGARSHVSVADCLVVRPCRRHSLNTSPVPFACTSPRHSALTLPCRMLLRSSPHASDLAIAPMSPFRFALLPAASLLPRGWLALRSQAPLLEVLLPTRGPLDRDIGEAACHQIGLTLPVTIFERLSRIYRAE